MKDIFDIYKYRIFVVLLFVASVYAVAYSDNPDNYRYYIRTRTMLNASGTSYLEKKDYVDGFGRTIETLLNSASPSGKDIFTFQEYDVLGRITNAWLSVPTTSAGGCFLSPSTFKSSSVSFYGDSAYSKTVYEASSLNRVLEQYGPGAAWITGGKSVKSGYQTNTSTGTLSCAWYKVQANNTLQKKGYYAANQLQITQTTDEDGHVSYTFTDKQGQKLLTRVMNSTANDTYYVYDDYGRLRYVIPPSAADTLAGTNGPWDPKSDPILKSYAYYYSYDGRGNCIGKKLPGCDSIAMVYDAGDRLVFSQDGNLKKNSLWTFNLYDTFGRLAVTGLGTSTNMSKFQSSYVKRLTRELPLRWAATPCRTLYPLP